MEYNERIASIIEYVEHHLQRSEETINNEEIAKLAGCSFHFFQKLFSYMYKISFAQYVRARKLTLAGYDIKSTNLKVIDIAYKYGYDSPTSFSKAFQLFHGISPSDARKKDYTLRVVPKMQYENKQQNMQYNWKVETMDSMRLVGKKTTISCINNNHFEEIPAFWNTCQKDGVFHIIAQLDKSNTGMFGIMLSYDEKQQSIEYMIATSTTQPIPKTFEEFILPPATWAIFDCIGAVPKAIQNGWQFLNEEWLVKYPFQHANCPEMEWYSNGNSFSDQYLSQIWIPIIEEE